MHCANCHQPMVVDKDPNLSLIARNCCPDCRPRIVAGYALLADLAAELHAKTNGPAVAARTLVAAPAGEARLLDGAAGRDNCERVQARQRNVDAVAFGVSKVEEKARARKV